MTAEPMNQVEAKYLHTPEAGVFVPLLQATITGLLFALAVLVVVLWQHVTDGYIFALLTWIGITLLCWMLLQRHWWTLTAIERYTGMDLNQDGVIGDPAPGPEKHTVDISLWDKKPGGFDQVDIVTLPFDENELATLAAGLQAGKPFTEREWCGSGKPLSSGQFRTARAEMLKRGMIELSSPKDPRRGYRLTRPGMAAIRYFAPPTPPHRSV